jgi:hypothetical protein
MVEVPGGVSRVEMNAKNGALDTPPDTTGVCCAKQLTGADAVIHGATSVSHNRVEWVHSGTFT